MHIHVSGSPVHRGSGPPRFEELLGLLPLQVSPAPWEAWCRTVEVDTVFA